MSRRIGNVICIEDEQDKKCELCGTVGDCRPYGPNFEQICFECGQTNKEMTERRMGQKLFGDPLDS